VKQGVGSCTRSKTGAGAIMGKTVERSKVDGKYGWKWYSQPSTVERTQEKSGRHGMQAGSDPIMEKSNENENSIHGVECNFC